jgi:phosphatidate phosphatase APP1
MQSHDQQPKSRKNWKERLLNWLGLTNEITIKAYHGYGHEKLVTLNGHVFKLSPLPRTRYTKSVINNTLALLRLFIVKTCPDVQVKLIWQGQSFLTHTDKDGLYKFEWVAGSITQGWKEVEVRAIKDDLILAKTIGYVYIPYSTQYGFISDIDDTFLISHSSNLRKRLYVLFTQNARSRKPFEGTVKHYQLLAKSYTTADAPNPFFYVSSSEWNLYDYILEFVTINGIPKGVFLLNQIKLFTQLLKTGQNNHQTKFTRIARILENYPNQLFILLGDSSQQDPYIYEAIVSHFPKQIYAVYIRDINIRNRKKVANVLAKIELAGVPCCFFKHSSDAISHSRKIGLISEAELA